MPQLRIHNAMELEALVQQTGFLPFSSCAIPNFSIEEFTPSRYWFVEGVDGPWEWWIELARRGVVAYGKLFAKKAGLVSREWYPDLANYRRDGYDFDTRYEEGLASHKEKRVMDVRPYALKSSEAPGRVWQRRLEGFRYSDYQSANADLCYRPQL